MLECFVSVENHDWWSRALKPSCQSRIDFVLEHFFGVSRGRGWWGMKCSWLVSKRSDYGFAFKFDPDYIGLQISQLVSDVQQLQVTQGKAKELATSEVQYSFDICRDDIVTLR